MSDFPHRQHHGAPSPARGRGGTSLRGVRRSPEWSPRRTSPAGWLLRRPGHTAGALHGVPPLRRRQFVASVIAGAYGHVEPGVHLAQGGAVEDDEIGVSRSEPCGASVDHDADDVLLSRRVWALLTRAVGVQMNP